MTSRGTILIGLLLCAVLLAATRLAPAPGDGGECKAIAIETNEAGYKSGYHVFAERDVVYTWFAGEAGLVVEGDSGTRTEFDPHSIDSFQCILEAP
jgi:hypothetical protein